MASLLLATVLSACSSDEPAADDAGDPSPSASASESGATGSGESAEPSASTTPYLDVPDDVELTEPGSQLELGESATVAYRPRQKQVAALDIKVTSIERTTFEKSFQGWETEGSQDKKPFFVRATVRNVGDTRLDGLSVPLYAATAANTLIESSSFSHEFKPCRPGALPDPFAPKARVDVCLVYLVPKDTRLTAVTFRPSEDFLPITWSGEITEAGQKPAKSPTPTPSESPEAPGSPEGGR